MTSISINKIVLTCMLVVALGALGWFEIFPGWARHKCAKVEYTEPARAAVSAISREEAAQNKKLLDRCWPEDPNDPWSHIFVPAECKEFEERSKERQAQEAIPTQEKSRPASDKEYQQCLREHGVK